MSLGEFVAEVHQHMHHTPDNDFAGRLTRADVEELQAWIDEADDGAA